MLHMSHYVKKRYSATASQHDSNSARQLDAAVNFWASERYSFKRENIYTVWEVQIINVCPSCVQGIVKFPYQSMYVPMFISFFANMHSSHSSSKPRRRLFETALTKFSYKNLSESTMSDYFTTLSWIVSR